MRPRVVIGAIVGAAVVLSLGAGVAPHNRLVRSSPASAATLPASPSEIRLWFAEAPLLGFSSVSVEGPGGAVKMSAVSIAEDRSLIAKITRTLPSGEYTVSWRTAGDDGHQVRGTWRFRIETPNAPSIP